MADLKLFDGWPGEKAICRILDLVGDGLHFYLDPSKTLRMGRAQIKLKTEEMISVARAEREVERLKRFPSLQHEDAPRPGERIEPMVTWPLTELAREAEAERLVRQQANVAGATVHALFEALEGNSQAAEESPTVDWVDRWRDAASSASDEDVQSMWGKVLAGEIDRPGTFSFRAIETLRLLSRRDAENISRLKPFVLDNGGIVDAHCLSAKGLTTNFLLEMEDLGMISSAAKTVMKITLDPFGPGGFAGFLQLGSLQLLAISEVKQHVSFHSYRLTRHGMEIMTLMNADADIDYFTEIATQLRNQHYKVRAAMEIRDGSGVWREIQLGETPPAENP